MNQAALSILLSQPVVIKNDRQRTELTASCQDSGYIPKAKNAGTIISRNGRRYQVMHNGILVEENCYYGAWMTNLIQKLRGHHEPQEEKVFFEILKKLGPNSTMIELGAFWAYYSLWFNKQIKGAQNICYEPDPNNLKVGERNAKANKAKNLEFIQAAAGSQDGDVVELTMDSDPTRKVQTKIVSVDKTVERKGWDRLDLLHADVQGAELDALRGASNIIATKKLRFLIVSTHHYLFSGTPLTHLDCLDFIRANGGHIIASHTVPESYSGDGLIAASFDKRDKDFVVDISLNHTDNALFRPYEKDISLLSGSLAKEVGG